MCFSDVFSQDTTTCQIFLEIQLPNKSLKLTQLRLVQKLLTFFKAVSSVINELKKLIKNNCGADDQTRLAGKT